MRSMMSEEVRREMDEVEETACVLEGTDTSDYSPKDAEYKSVMDLDDSVVLAAGSSQRSNYQELAWRQRISTIVPHGGLAANAYNLGSVTLGGGIIALPAAFNQAGYALAIGALLFCTWATIYSMYLLAVSAERTQITSYERMTLVLFGRGWDQFLAFVMWILAFGTCVSYVISVGDLLTPVLRPKDANGNTMVLESIPDFLQTVAGKRCLVALVWVCVMLPLSLPKHINSLRYASVVGVTCMMYFVICVVVHSIRGFEDGHSTKEMVAIQSGNNVIVGLSLFIFSFLCHTNFFKVYEEMKHRSPARFSVHCSVSMCACCALYLIAGMFGYADFGGAITQSILLYYNVREDAMVAVAYFGVGFKLCVGFALSMQPCRDAAYHAFHVNLDRIAWWKNATICASLSFAALILGLFIPSVTVVFGLTGSFCGGIIGFIFPAYFVMYSGDWGLKQVGWFHYISTYILLMSGVVALVFGTIAGIYVEI